MTASHDFVTESEGARISGITAAGKAIPFLDRPLWSVRGFDTGSDANTVSTLFDASDCTWSRDVVTGVSTYTHAASSSTVTVTVTAGDDYMDIKLAVALGSGIAASVSAESAQLQFRMAPLGNSEDFALVWPDLQGQIISEPHLSITGKRSGTYPAIVLNDGLPSTAVLDYSSGVQQQQYVYAYDQREGFGLLAMTNEANGRVVRWTEESTGEAVDLSIRVYPEDGTSARSWTMSQTLRLKVQQGDEYEALAAYVAHATKANVPAYVQTPAVARVNSPSWVKKAVAYAYLNSGINPTSANAVPFERDVRAVAAYVGLEPEEVTGVAYGVQGKPIGDEWSEAQFPPQAETLAALKSLHEDGYSIGLYQIPPRVHPDDEFAAAEAGNYIGDVIHGVDGEAYTDRLPGGTSTTASGNTADSDVHAYLRFRDPVTAPELARRVGLKVAEDFKFIPRSTYSDAVNTHAVPRDWDPSVPASERGLGSAVQAGRTVDYIRAWRKQFASIGLGPHAMFGEDLHESLAAHLDLNISQGLAYNGYDFTQPFNPLPRPFLSHIHATGHITRWASKGAVWSLRVVNETRDADMYDVGADWCLGKMLSFQSFPTQFPLAPIEESSANWQEWKKPVWDLARDLYGSSTALVAKYHSGKRLAPPPESHMRRIARIGPTYTTLVAQPSQIIVPIPNESMLGIQTGLFQCVEDGSVALFASNPHRTRTQQLTVTLDPARYPEIGTGTRAIRRHDLYTGSVTVEGGSSGDVLVLALNIPPASGEIVTIYPGAAVLSGVTTQRANHIAQAGSPTAIPATIVDGNGDKVELRDGSARYEVRIGSADNPVLIRRTEADGVTLDEGAVTVAIPGDLTRAMQGDYHHSLHVTTAEGIEIEIFNGTLGVRR